MSIKNLAFLAVIAVIPACAQTTPPPWVIDSAQTWRTAALKVDQLEITDDGVAPTADTATFTSTIRSFDTPRQPAQLRVQQTPEWNNWMPVPAVGPKNTTNAPVFLPIGDDDYWYFAAQVGKFGYHAWHSTDMINWVHHGQVSESHWLTTAEYADGQFYLYFDQPNDEDPHLIIDTDLTDGDLNNTVIGKVFADPSHGSDAGILRDADGTFHLIYEDWSPVNASTHSWDSPLAGHADSDDGIHGFHPHEHPAPIDQRTTPTGEVKPYNHPAADLKNKAHNPTGIKLKPFVYDVHTPDQNAYGDYTLIRVGSHFYIFCDFDPVKGKMRVGSWVSDDINKQFTWMGSIGSGFHPDPTVGFAEGQFYLLVQRADIDFISSGPWNDTVRARAGVDSTGDGAIDTWSTWQEVREHYDHRPGFARVVDTTPATLDLSMLPRAHAVQFELAMTAANAEALPILDQVTFEFAPNR